MIINKYPLWKYLLLIVVLIVSILYFLPNLYGEDPAVQISALRGAKIDVTTQETVRKSLDTAKLPYIGLSSTPGQLMVRFNNTEDQLKGKDLIKRALGDNYVAALNLAPRTPKWLLDINAKPMYLGLDLRGGVHFLMEVDVDAAVDQAEERYINDFRSMLRENHVRYKQIERIAQKQGGGVQLKFTDAETRQKATDVINKEDPSLIASDSEADGAFYLTMKLSDKEKADVRKLALKQNITTLRNRVNELGVAEPLIQQQGTNRIVVELPGVQDTAQAKRILGATATLEFRLAAEQPDVQAAMEGKIKPGWKLYNMRGGGKALLKNRVMLTGDSITDAQSGLDQSSGGPAVFITLDGQGASMFSKVTGENIHKLMGVVYIETKMDTHKVDGKVVKTPHKIEEVINVARIQDQLSKRFQITGLDSTEEAHNLALLLRAGALAVPIDIAEERTVGPSLGQENIDEGKKSVVLGFILVLVFMALWYRGFGMIANLALFFNLIIIVALMSLIQATLTLPGIAGIVLTLGMAVDANVLIFERIREEIRLGNSPQASIHAGYAKAFSTIADSNITTLIAGIVLFGLGSGPVKGFAVTLSLGILTSMFTAIMGTRAIVNLMVGGKRLEKLSV